MQIAGAIAQGVFGRLGSYAVSLLAGLVSSASAVDSAMTTPQLNGYLGT